MSKVLVAISWTCTLFALGTVIGCWLNGDVHTTVETLLSVIAIALIGGNLDSYAVDAWESEETERE